MKSINTILNLPVQTIFFKMIKINIEKIGSSKIIILATFNKILATKIVLNFTTYKGLYKPSASVRSSPAYTPTKVFAGIFFVLANTPTNLSRL